MAATCNICSTNISKGRFPGIKCSGSCNKLFHIKCANISDELLSGIKNCSANWLCEVCRCKTNQSLVDGDDDSVDSATNSVSLYDIMFQLKRMEKKLSSLDELKAIVKSLESENEFLKSTVRQLEENFITYSNKLYQLEADNDKPKQQQCANDIVISGLPLKHDDIKGLIINTINKVGVEINSDDILSIEGIENNKTNVPTNKSNKNNNNPILHNFFNVKLRSIDIKNNILSQARKYKSLATRDLDVFLPQNHPEQRIYIMHRLTAFQSKLYRDAKIIKLSQNYRYLWCKAGQIYLRKSAESDVHRIYSFNDIFRLKSEHRPSD